jgi:hypothetical protein
MHERTMRPAISEATLAKLDRALAATAPREELPARRPAARTKDESPGEPIRMTHFVERLRHWLGVGHSPSARTRRSVMTSPTTVAVMPKA